MQKKFSKLNFFFYNIFLTLDIDLIEVKTVQKTENNNNTKEKNKRKEDFNIIVTYAENGQSFQSIAENIIIRKMNEFN